MNAHWEDSELSRALHHALEQAGIEDHYWDLWGTRHDTSPEAAASLLAAMGYDVSSAAALNTSVETRRLREAARLLPETIVVRVSEQPFQLPVQAEAPYEIRLVEENHEPGTAPREFRWQNSPTVPHPPPLGYHRIEITAQGIIQSAHLIVCPERAYLPQVEPEPNRKFAGLGVFLPGLRDAKTWGCGDFRSLARLAEWATREMKVAYIALNPLQAIHNRSPFNTSPYLPNSLLYRNFIYLDIETLPDFPESPAARRMRAASRVRAEIDQLNAADLVDYERVARLKHLFLLHLFRSFWQRHWRLNTARAKAFQEYLTQQGKPLALFALHSALDRHLHRIDNNVWNFPAWPEAYQDPESLACEGFSAENPRALLFHKWVQWQIDQQIGETQHRARAAGMAIGLFHDLPLATDRYGAELWGHGKFFLKQGGVGAPPDAIAPHGQDWGFPPPDRDAHRRDGYQHFAHTIRASAHHGGALRLDHVMRLFRLYTIPPGKTAMDGVYVRDYARDLLGVLALESVRNQVVIIGEDLGTVADGVREALLDAAVLSYRLLYFERVSDSEFKPPSAYPPLALVSTTTHDLPTIAGYWLGRDIELRRECGLIPDEAAYQRELDDRVVSKQGILNALASAGLWPESYGHAAADYPELTGELHNAMVGFLAETPSLLMTVNQEDLTKETEQQNLPGTVSQYPNWCRKMRMTLEELIAEHDYTAMLRHWIETSGRG